jgi:hypothetical protein
VDVINLQNQKRRRNFGWLGLALFLFLAAGTSFVVWNGNFRTVSGIADLQQTTASGMNAGDNQSTLDNAQANSASDSEDPFLNNENTLASSEADKKYLQDDAGISANRVHSENESSEFKNSSQAQSVKDKSKPKTDQSSAARNTLSRPNETTPRQAGRNGKNTTASQGSDRSHQIQSGVEKTSSDLVTQSPINNVTLRDALAASMNGNMEQVYATTGLTANQLGASQNMVMASLDKQAASMMGRYSQMAITTQIKVLGIERRADPKTDCPTFGKIGLSYLVGVHGGASYPFSKWSSTEEGADLKQLRQDSEQSLVAGNMGVDFIIRHRSGLEFTTGLQRTSLLERMELVRTVTSTETEYGIQAISINPLGDTTFIMGDVPVTTTTMERKRFYNKYTFIEIPLMIGFHKEIENWRVGGEVGVVAGFLTKTEGKVLDINEDFSDLSAQNDAVSGSKFGMSYYFGATVAYMYESGIELGLSPNVRIAPKDFGAADYPVRKKYLLAGANISLRYRFGGK